MSVQEIKDEGEFEEIKKTDKLVVVDFFADWCGPCRAISPKVKEFAQKYPDVVFCKVNVDDNDEITQKCGISAMPTFQGYKNGVKVFDFTGANESKLEEEIMKAK